MRNEVENLYKDIDIDWVLEVEMQVLIVIVREKVEKKILRKLTEHINNLQKQLDPITYSFDPTWSTKSFCKLKQVPLKILSSLLNKLH